jgi:predicted adenine nucleotide alpha hydrolase (AANH) superfamily ATPase
MGDWGGYNGGMTAVDKPRLLLHVCCGPCSVTVLERMLPGYDVRGYFYNPNIQPRREYGFRLAEFSKTARHFGVEWTEGEYDATAWFARMRGLEKEPERGARCRECIALRLERAFAQARGLGCATVATTLAISPYKDWEQIRALGEELACRHGVAFLADNFRARNGFAAGRQKARDLGIGIQTYCGCVYSKLERLLARRRVKNQAAGDARAGS